MRKAAVYRVSADVKSATAGFPRSSDHLRLDFTCIFGLDGNINSGLFQ